jgi:hypothetical protein
MSRGREVAEARVLPLEVVVALAVGISCGVAGSPLPSAPRRDRRCAATPT